MEDQATATDQTMPPGFRDIVDQLPHAHPENVTHKQVSGTKLLAMHYTDEFAPVGYDPIAYMIREALFHIHKNWGRAGQRPVYGFGIMYHYMIDRLGQGYRTQPENLLTWNATYANAIDIACCFHLGEGQSPSDAQLHTMQVYLDFMCHHRPDFPAGQHDVWGHGELTQYGNATSCPGLMLPHVRSYRATGRV